MAKRVKGIDNARAKPNIPIAGPAVAPIDAAWTRSVPIIGPVQEKETSERVNAMKNILSNPVVESALLSSFVVHEDGRVISNAPRKEIAKTTRSKKNIILKIAFVARLLRALAPNAPVMIKPRATYIITIETPYVIASQIYLFLSFVRF